MKGAALFLVVLTGCGSAIVEEPPGQPVEAGACRGSIEVRACDRYQVALCERYAQCCRNPDGSCNHRCPSGSCASTEACREGMRATLFRCEDYPKPVCTTTVNQCLYDLGVAPSCGDIRDGNARIPASCATMLRGLGQ